MTADSEKRLKAGLRTYGTATLQYSALLLTPGVALCVLTVICDAAMVCAPSLTCQVQAVAYCEMNGAQASIVRSASSLLSGGRKLTTRSTPALT